MYGPDNSTFRIANLSRARVLQARAALAGFKTKNEAAGIIVRAYRRLSRFVVKSNVFRADVKSAETKVMNVLKPTEVLLPCATRWLGVLHNLKVRT